MINKIATIKSKEFYEFYACQHFKQYTETARQRGIINKSSKYYMNIQTYNKLLDTLNIALRDLIINESFEFNIPYRLGVLAIKKSKPEPYIDENGNVVNILPVDWKSTLELWEEDEDSKNRKILVRHLNAHTQGYVVKWKYDIKKANYTFKSAYKFIPCRAAKRLLTPILKDPTNKTDFYLE